MAQLLRKRLARISDGVVKTDVLIVGSGGSALTAALRVRSAGLSALVVEKSAKVGGTTTYSGGGHWIPNTHLHEGANDSPEEALEYMEAIIGDAGPASSRERKLAFLQNGPKMVKFLEDEGFRWRKTVGYPDYFPEQRGGKIGGRGVEPAMFDLNVLGPWKDRLNFNPTRPPFPVYTYELSKLVRAKSSWDGMFMAIRVFGLRQYPQILLGNSPCTLGVSMVGQLLYLNIEKGVSIWTESPMTDLVVKDGQVTGAIVEKVGKKITIEASRGVILAAGGFAKNTEMRKKYQASPITSDWTSVIPTDQGDAISAALKIGAATALMDAAWWGAAMVDPKSGQAFWCLYDRVLPHSIIVDQTAERFTNESQNYNSIGHALWKRNEVSPAIPSFLILDSNHRDRYVLAGRLMPGHTPQEVLDSGFVTKAETIQELAEKLDLSASVLGETVKRFNGFVSSGVDKDFHRGESAYDSFMGDPSYSPNRNLGAIERGPFYAVKLWPGDLGTKGGILTDEYARALKEDSDGGRQVIQGLYAVGNSSASVMGRTYAGPGATLGPALTFAYIAANHIIKHDD
ncbi:fumarate reductase/succinate dehydrogenase flavo protein domain-containing protein [Lindgomyces ingoldianus]|uniref:Fumarate reductase/succinate dehydrogenase flavo protein domain-containing protein n=1 Tax=Lindgomyces ingoldianus TaxID=673940 RepID=A0ACB6R6U9_9PLEO|nr:fumarate reductase/succinate dehydrogenase flavo protein domain-containing protein [Lindgomyces ingoldianus]KAF2474548.1 fumarate reductase/succinate dehydrogenase flavo protein domain-containing protein [Lindgomyces ingoldianus]